MKKLTIVHSTLALLVALAWQQTYAEKLSADKIFKESRENQLCGEFIADSGTYDKFIFADKSTVSLVAMGMEFPAIYFISENIVYIKTDKAILELEIVSPILLRGKDMFTQGSTYKQDKKSDKVCIPPDRTELGNLVCFLNGIELKKEGKLEDASAKFLQCCNAGNAESCNHYGLLRHLVVSPDMKIAVEYYQKACAMGYGGGCSNLANMEKKRGNLSKAKQLFQEACKKGHQGSCFEALSMEE